MSSFVISKQEYIKAAGYIAGIAAGTSIGSREFWLYDTIERKNTDKQLYYKRFSQCYEMNAKSVQEQYKDSEPEQDANEYKKEFETYYKKGYTLNMEDRDTKLRAISGIQQFFHSVLYQTENEKYNFLMTHWFFRIEDELMESLLLRGYTSENWGTFEAPDTKRNITRIA